MFNLSILMSYLSGELNINDQPFSNSDLFFSDILTMLYSITYMYYSLLGTFVTVFVGVIVSYMTGKNKTDTNNYIQIN